MLFHLQHGGGRQQQAAMHGMVPQAVQRCSAQRGSEPGNVILFILLMLPTTGHCGH